MATALAIAALLILLLVTAANGQTSQPLFGPGSEFGPGSGAEDFLRHCSACHAGDARGDGPAAPMLMHRPADMSLLASRNGGDYPGDRVFWMIDGRGEVRAHGPREMPVWGYEFSRSTTGLSLAPEAGARIQRLVDYLETLQQPVDWGWAQSPMRAMPFQGRYPRQLTLLVKPAPGVHRWTTRRGRARSHH